MKGTREMGKIFLKVHCKAYLKRINDGVYLNCFLVDEIGCWKRPATGNSWRDTNVKVEAVRREYKDGIWQENKIADLSGFEGETVDKTYRERIEEEFDGFLVGFTRITTTGKIGTDMTMLPYNMNGDLEEVYHLTKETKQERVGVVYFKNNSKRYVLEDDIKVYY